MEMYIGLAVSLSSLIWVVMTYNRFISLRRFKRSLSGTLPYSLSAATTCAESAEPGERYAQHEKELLEEISPATGRQYPTDRRQRTSVLWYAEARFRAWRSVPGT